MWELGEQAVCRLLLSSDGSTLCPETSAHTITSWYFCLGVYSTIEIKILMSHAFGVAEFLGFFRFSLLWKGNMKMDLFPCTGERTEIQLRCEYRQNKLDGD